MRYRRVKLLPLACQIIARSAFPTVRESFLESSIDVAAGMRDPLQTKHASPPPPDTPSYAPRIAPSDSWRSLHNARVPSALWTPWTTRRWNDMRRSVTSLSEAVCRSSSGRHLTPVVAAHADKG